VINDKLPTLEHHGWRYMRFGPDGWLYIGIGAPCNICKRDEADLRHDLADAPRRHRSRGIRQRRPQLGRL